MFQDRWQPSTAAIQAKGQLRLLDFANGLDFDPVLSGELSVLPRQGVNLQLAGVQDRISLVLSPTYQPVSFCPARRGDHNRGAERCAAGEK